MVAVALGDRGHGFDPAPTRGGYSYCLLLVALCLVKPALISILKSKNILTSILISLKILTVTPSPPQTGLSIFMAGQEKLQKWLLEVFSLAERKSLKLSIILTSRSYF